MSTARACFGTKAGPKLRATKPPRVDRTAPLSAKAFQERLARELDDFTAWLGGGGVPRAAALYVEMRDTGGPRVARSAVYECEALIALLAERCAEPALDPGEQKKLRNALATFTPHARQCGFAFLDTVPFIAVRYDDRGRITHTAAGVK